MESKRPQLSVVPPSGSHPTRSKSLRQQRANNGAYVIKAYVQKSEQRREHAKFNTTILTRHKHESGERYEDQVAPSTIPTPRVRDLSNEADSNQDDIVDDVHTLDALFAGHKSDLSRPTSTFLHHRTSFVYSQDSAVKNNCDSMRRASNCLPQRSVPLRSPILPQPVQRPKHNLAAKLDAMSRSPVRKLGIQEQRSIRNMISRVGGASPRHHNTPKTESSNNQLTGAVETTAKKEADAEMKVLSAFRQIVRLWRERKRRAEAAAVTMMSNGMTNGTGRHGSRNRKDLMAESNVVGILSRRMIREVPALKFFDEDGIEHNDPLSPLLFQPSSGPAQDRARPRGVCYTLDASGCRKIKMQSSTGAPSRTRIHHRRETHNEVTWEKAMQRNLRRKMVGRIKNRRHALLRLTDEFGNVRRDLAMKLRSQLALQRAEFEKMSRKRLSLAMTDDTTLPPYKAVKELQLSRVRSKKADVLEQCETLRVLGRVMQFVQEAGERTGQDITTGELRFLELFRCVVEDDHVLTPIISASIRQHMSQDLQQPMVTELFRILDSETHNTTR